MMHDREKVIADIEEQIAWIRDNDFHKFPGWGHAVLAMKDALALLKEQQQYIWELQDQVEYLTDKLKEQEQKTGHWTTKRTLQHDGEWYCDQCEYEPTVFEDTPFCPNCGAKMESRWSE